MPRKKKQHYYIYKTTSLIDGKYYIGMHSTNNLNDGYIGSGKKLWRYIRKYGKESFKFEILEFLPNRESLKNREREIVNENLLKDMMCLNLSMGGGGGISSKSHMVKFLNSARINREKRLQKWKKDSEFRKIETQKLIEYTKQNHKMGIVKAPNWSGKKHKEESKLKISKAVSITSKGDRNSQYGTRWVTNGKENKKIKNGMDLPNGWRFGRVNANIKIH